MKCKNFGKRKATATALMILQSLIPSIVSQCGIQQGMTRKTMILEWEEQALMAEI